MPSLRSERISSSPRKAGSGPRQGAEAELDLSLKTMKTDHVDLWQMHGVNHMQDVEQIFAPGGAIEAFEAAKKAGKCRFIGYTNCRDPQVHVAMLKHAERFDTALMPLHVADTSYSENPKMSFVKTALPAAIERGVGILGIKVFGNAFLLRTFSAPDCLKYSLSLPVTACPLGFNTIGQLEDDVRTAQNFKPLSEKRRTRCGRAPVAENSTLSPARRWSTGKPATDYGQRRPGMGIVDRFLSPAFGAELPGAARGA